MNGDRSKVVPFSCALALVALAAPPPAAGQAAARFAVVAGSNRGNDPVKTLRFAERDAERFAEVLVRLGGFREENVQVLSGPSPRELLGALGELNRRIHEVVPERYPKAMAVVYFSGHADGVHLELGKDTLRFSKLRSLIEDLDADVKILFVDSCQSGGVTAYKGGHPGPSFDLVFSETIDANGTAILTSSAAGEKSQESGRLEGSFFTHFLLSGLRGTADFDQDQRVTLQEIYQYTYSKTVAETSRTMGGAQHPTYDYQMTGRGEVVLTDLTRGETQLQFGPEMYGTYLVVTRETREVVAEVNKPRGSWRAVALPADDYLVASQRQGGVASAEVTVEQGKRVRLMESALRPERSLDVVLEKGSPKQRGIGLGLYYGLLSGSLKHYAALHQGILGLRADLGPLTLFPRVSVGATHVAEEGLDYQILIVSGESYLTWRFDRSAVDLFAGIGVSVGYGRQRISGDELRTGTIFAYTGVGGLEVPFSSGFALSLFWEVGSQVYRAESRLAQHLLLRGSLGMGYHF
jgi:hypothetical protein